MSQKPVIAVCANQAWNLVNFRAGLISALIERGFKVHAIAPGDDEMERRLRALGCEFTPLEIDAAGLSPFRDFRTFLAVARILRRVRPAAWLSWTIKPNVYGSLAAGLMGIPALPNVSGLGTAFIRRNLLTVIAKALYRNGFRKAPTVFFQNNDDKAEFVDGGMVTALQARLLPGSGIDPAVWSPPAGGRPAPRRFLMLSRVVADKGVREFVEAAAQVRASYPDAEFVLMGALDAPNRTAIPIAEVRGWTENGIITHLPPSDDVKTQIAAASFVVLPSYREGLSRVLLEASAMGRPIITTDVPGCRDIVSEGFNGFLCAAQDAGSLAQALLRAAALDDAAWQTLADNGRARVIESFSQETVNRIYFAALASAGVHPPASNVLA